MACLKNLVDDGFADVTILEESYVHCLFWCSLSLCYETTQSMSLYVDYASLYAETCLS